VKRLLLGSVGHEACGVRHKQLQLKAVDRSSSSVQNSTSSCLPFAPVASKQASERHPCRELAVPAALG
jgi:hypothetical protein